MPQTHAIAPRTPSTRPDGQRPRVVIVGCGFGGLEAAKALAGAGFKITQQRGLWLPDHWWGGGLVASWHPSFILRQRGPDREARFGELTADLTAAADHL